MKSYVSLETENTKMEYDQELLERKKMLEGEIETLERKLRDTKEELLQVEEELRSDGNIMNYEKNVRDNADRYESDENSSEEKRETRKRKTNKKRRTVKRMIKRLRNEIEEEESKDNVQYTDTEIINGYGILKGQEMLLKLRWYNYAESFQMRIIEEMERDLSISEQTARTKVYKKIQEIKKLSEEDYTKLRKMTSKAERFYRVIEKAGGDRKSVRVGKECR